MHSREFYKAVMALRMLDGPHMSMALHAALFWSEQQLLAELEEADVKGGPVPAKEFQH
jgi:hypothetical protein